MRKADNLPPYRAVVMKSGSLNFLEPSGPARPVMGELSSAVTFIVIIIIIYLLPLYRLFTIT